MVVLSICTNFAEELHQQVTILKDSVATSSQISKENSKEAEDVPEESFKQEEKSLVESEVQKVEFKAEEGAAQEDQVLAITEDLGEENGESPPKESIEESEKDLENQLLITQLKARISELEVKGENLQKDKEKLEVRIECRRKNTSH